MEWLLVLAFVLIVAGFVSWLLSTVANRAGGVAAAPSAVTGTIKDDGDSEPLELHDCMLLGRGRVSVVGEQFYDRAIKRVCAGLGRRPAAVGNWDAGVHTVAFLLREPGNRHDRNAVVVKMMTGSDLVTVGYIAATDAPTWHPLLDMLGRRGEAAMCHAYIYRSRNGRQYQIILRVAPPDEALPANDFPAGAIPLEPGREAALFGESNHQDVLAGREGQTAWGTLHRGEIEAGTHKGEPAVEVRLDGQVAGSLSAAQSERYGVLMDRGPAACEMDIFHGKRGAEARVWLPKID